MHLTGQLRDDPPPTRGTMRVDFSSIPIGRSVFFPHEAPQDFIRFVRYSARTWKRHNPGAQLSICLVHAPGQVCEPHSPPPIGIQVWRKS